MNTRTHERQSQPGGPERLINAEAERLIVGNILARPGLFRSVGPQLTDDCFAVEQYLRVYQLARKIHEAGGDPDLSECLRSILAAGKTTDEMGLPALTALAWDNQVELTDPAPWIRDLRHKAAERRLWRVAERLRTGVETGIDASAELTAAREELRAIEGSFDGSAVNAVTISDAVASIGIDNLLAAPQGTISWPYERLTNLTNGGLRRGELCLLASRPSVGKSTVALQVSLAAAAAGHRTLMVSLEMPQRDLIKRALSAEGEIPHGLLVSGNLDRAWRMRVAETLARIGDYPLEITDKLRTLAAIIGKVAATPGLELLVIDYLGLVDPGGTFENRNQEISSISRRLKLAALDHDIPILGLHQLSRANETENRRPQLSDLRDSGSLEQDADAVLLLDAPGRRKHGSDIDKELIDLQIAKQRNGVLGITVPLRLEGKFCRIVDAEIGFQSEARRSAPGVLVA